MLFVMFLSTSPAPMSPLLHSNYLKKEILENIGVVTLWKMFSEFSLII